MAHFIKRTVSGFLVVVLIASTALALPLTAYGSGNESYEGTYEGEYDSGGKRSGYGTWIYHNFRYDGNWENDMPNGEGILYQSRDTSGDVISIVRGNWVDGLANGTVTYYELDSYVFTSDSWERSPGYTDARAYRVEIKDGHPTRDETLYDHTEEKNALEVRESELLAGVPPWADAECNAAAAPAGTNVDKDAKGRLLGEYGGNFSFKFYDEFRFTIRDGLIYVHDPYFGPQKTRINGDGSAAQHVDEWEFYYSPWRWRWNSYENGESTCSLDNYRISGKIVYLEREEPSDTGYTGHLYKLAYVDDNPYLTGRTVVKDLGKGVYKIRFVDDEWIYYTACTEDLFGMNDEKVCRIRLDGKEESDVIPSNEVPSGGALRACFVGEYVYYLDNYEQSITRRRLDGGGKSGKSEVVFPGFYGGIYDLAAAGDYLYFLGDGVRYRHMIESPFFNTGGIYIGKLRIADAIPGTPVEELFEKTERHTVGRNPLDTSQYAISLYAAYDWLYYQPEEANSGANGEELIMIRTDFSEQKKVGDIMNASSQPQVSQVSTAYDGGDNAYEGTYEGEYDSEGKRSGYGTWAYHNFLYVGNWENDMPNGEGTLYRHVVGTRDEQRFLVKIIARGNWVDGFGDGPFEESWIDSSGGASIDRYDVEKGYDASGWPAAVVPPWASIGTDSTLPTPLASFEFDPDIDFSEVLEEKARPTPSQGEVDRNQGTTEPLTAEGSTDGGGEPELIKNEGNEQDFAPQSASSVTGTSHTIEALGFDVVVPDDWEIGDQSDGYAVFYAPKRDASLETDTLLATFALTGDSREFKWIIGVRELYYVQNARENLFARITRDMFEMPAIDRVARLELRKGKIASILDLLSGENPAIGYVVTGVAADGPKISVSLMLPSVYDTLTEVNIMVPADGSQDIAWFFDAMEAKYPEMRALRTVVAECMDTDLEEEQAAVPAEKATALTDDEITEILNNITACTPTEFGEAFARAPMEAYWRLTEKGVSVQPILQYFEEQGGLTKPKAGKGSVTFTVLGEYQEQWGGNSKITAPIAKLSAKTWTAPTASLLPMVQALEEQWNSPKGLGMAFASDPQKAYWDLVENGISMQPIFQYFEKQGGLMKPKTDDGKIEFTVAKKQQERWNDSKTLKLPLALTDEKARTASTQSMLGLVKQLARLWLPSAPFTYGNVNNGARITGYRAKPTGELSVPSKLGPLSVWSIGEEAFSGCAGLTSATLPDSVTTICARAFSGCSGLTSALIPNSVVIIEAGAFQGCAGLPNMVIPDSVMMLGDEAFQGCTSLNGMTIASSVISIGNGAFDACGNITLSVTEGSYAEQYAKDNGIAYAYIE